MKILVRSIGLVLLAFLFYIAGVLIHGTLTDYRGENITLSNEGKGRKEILSDSIFSMYIWNLGYAGLGKEKAFFYDQGKSLHSGAETVRLEKSLVDKNQEGILSSLASMPADFYLFQEVDRHSKRSYYLNQYEEIGEELSNFSSFFSTNYKVKRVPIPILQPFQVYGEVLSGLATYSKWTPQEAKRYQLPGEYGWPTRIFQLDRCLLETRFSMTSGKELVILNIHNSAYDEGGKLKKLQMDYIREMALEEYALGNYVVLGGDWNQYPPYFKNPFVHPSLGPTLQANIDAELFPQNWIWAYDPLIPTNRKNQTPYELGKTPVSLIDFYLVSPNIQILQVKTMDQQFDFSDHQAVRLEFKLL